MGNVNRCESNNWNLDMVIRIGGLPSLVLFRDVIGGYEILEEI